MRVVNQKKTRLVCFRLSAKEYERLRQLCEASGARCLSDVARSALRQVLVSTVESIDLDPSMELLRDVKSVATEICMTVNRMNEILTAVARVGGRASLVPADPALSYPVGILE